MPALARVLVEEGHARVIQVPDRAIAAIVAAVPVRPLVVTQGAQGRGLQAVEATGNVLEPGPKRNIPG
jgi:hypothetical protein